MANWKRKLRGLRDIDSLPFTVTRTHRRSSLNGGLNASLFYGSPLSRIVDDDIGQRSK